MFSLTLVTCATDFAILIFFVCRLVINCQFFFFHKLKQNSCRATLQKKSTLITILFRKSREYLLSVSSQITLVLLM